MTAGSLNWKIEGKEKVTRQDCGMSSKREDSWHRKVCGTSPESKYCRTEVHCLRKKETLKDSTRPSTNKIS